MIILGQPSRCEWACSNWCSGERQAGGCLVGCFVGKQRWASSTPKQCAATAAARRGMARCTHILFLQRALLAVVRIGDAHAATDDAAALVRTIVALLTHAHQRCRSHIRVTDGALTITLFAQATNRCKYNNAHSRQTKRLGRCCCCPPPHSLHSSDSPGGPSPQLHTAMHALFITHQFLVASCT